ncbi:MAG: hypothetical protein GTO45_27235 [Candidatus Aminicenantes bacterium]|nr:hypothetical protein [Candidatus Aminicenantes bacterium]NIM82475.1 hypothetical protein [Candidatus Aminicenantes bacterium]NIN21850.1 hypothetical protein [Candidatus Aminicenantes bacterium]NIN45628.1 hypothetical protein [Candidatus Aminicenantes bacterium]NIN88462.1 hypothetical protein [Candidatus Aminicenantes bacterium]
MKKKYTFFLGGLDAEMVTIREILDAKKIPYFDKHLTWGASLSQYKEELMGLSKGQVPVFVELRLDIDYPEQAIVIDHHNERAGKNRQTSLEQASDLLGVQLNRYQHLISANDRGHIPAMKALGATLKEIEEIRRYDRQCQGVTQKDEKLAKESIQHHSEKLAPDAILVNSLTEKSSPVMDRLYDKFAHLFIVSPSNELNYFGPGKMIDRLETLYRKLKQSKPDIFFWKGGNLPDRGFFGSNFAIDKKQIKELFT